MKLEIKITDNDGNVQQYVTSGSLHQLVWDGFLTAELQNEQWHDRDTCELIVNKLKGKSPIEYANL
jgi:hypothetical protein